jgi:cyclopropane-fatty-acyl-phospholipid synthase
MVTTDTIGPGVEPGSNRGRVLDESDRKQPRPPSGKRSVATWVGPLLGSLYGETLPVRFVFWDTSVLGPDNTRSTVSVHSVDALRYIVWAPGELGLARAYVAGLITVEGAIFDTLRVLRDGATMDLRSIGLGLTKKLLPAARALGLLRRAPAPPSIEARPGGRLHSRQRDAAAISHHYDVGNDFYRLVLGPSMTYSCARFVSEGATLDEAQWAKHDLICRKLGLDQQRGMTLLDVGCGWGSLCLHAAEHYGARVVGITLSRGQAEWATKRIEHAALTDRVEIRLEDYRSLKGEQFDAISSVGMFEHVGSSQAALYFEVLAALLAPGGRLINHAISTPGGSKIERRSFIGRYVFPDGELIDVGQVVLGMERASLEVRDVESLREHYSRTLHAWVTNLMDSWDEAVALVGPARARVWLLYMAASANGFDDGGLGIHQVLGVKPLADGTSLMPATRASWEDSQ